MVRKPRSIWSPNNLSDALIKEQNKLIHLDPVPLFKDRHEIKLWLQKIFFPQGINLVIERSDSSKIIFKCKASTSKHRQNGGTVKNRVFCPFRIRATYSIKLQKWNILIVNNVHSHDLIFDPSTDEYRKFKSSLVSLNDADTIKFFEELEYKTKFNLPVSLPSSTQIMTCDCGLTNEVNWFNNIVIPEPSIINKSKITKSRNKDHFSYKKGLISSNSSSLSSVLNNKATQSNDSMINLDEIDFTDMFKPLKKNVPKLKDQTSIIVPFPSPNIMEPYPSDTTYNPNDDIFSLFNCSNTNTCTTVTDELLQGKHDELDLVQDDDYSWLDRYLDFNQESPPTLLQANDNTLQGPTMMDDESYLDFLNLTDSCPSTSK